MSDLIDRQRALDAFDYWVKSPMVGYSNGLVRLHEMLEEIPPAKPEPGWNNHQIACMLADLFGDACACNYNGNDEWLSELCDFKDTCCPNPVGVACWEQFLKYSQSRYMECDYEIRDKNALQKQNTGHWIKIDDCSNSGYYCSKCNKKVVKEGWSDTVKKIKYCPNCGCRMMQEVQDADSN